MPPEVEIRKGLAKIGHERLDVFTATARRMKRVLQQHVGSSNLVEDLEITCLAPEMGEPTAYDGLVVVFLSHFKHLE